MRSSTVHHGGVGFGRLFFQGIRLADRKDTLDLAAKDFNVPVSKVVQYCTRNQPANFWDAMLNHFYLARYAIALILAVAI
jgi:hypothetical protein